METLIFVAFAVPLVTVVAVLGRRRVAASWKEAAAVIGLTLRTKRPGGDPVLEGAVGSARVQVDTVDRQRPGSNKKAAWTRIRAGADIPKGLLVGGEGFWHHWNETHGQESVEMAGVAFDDHVIVRGAIPEIFALLNGDTRAQFRDLEKELRTYVMDGTVHVERQGILREPDELSKLVRRVARLAMALSLQGPSIADRLGTNVVTDPNALVRLRNLEVLLDRYPGTPAVQLACEHALGDRSYAVSVLAARQCGDEGTPTLERVLADERAPLALRRECLEHLLETSETADPIAFLEGVVSEHPQLRSAAVTALADLGHDPGNVLLLELLSAGRPEGWIAFARAIASLQRNDLAGPLEALLDEDAAIETLEFEFATEDPSDPVIDQDPIVVEITSELRIDHDVQSAATSAIQSLNGLDEDEDGEENEGGEEDEDAQVTPKPRFDTLTDELDVQDYGEDSAALHVANPWEIHAEDSDRARGPVDVDPNVGSPSETELEANAE